MRPHPLPITVLNRLFYIWIPVVSFLGLILLDFWNPALFSAIATGEDGVIELTHIVLGFAGFVIALRLLLHYWRARNRLGISFALFSLAVCLYITLEEASYGQHLFGWKATGFFQEVNKQQETNLHNISSWFNEKPRVILELAIILGGLLLPLFPRQVLRFVPTGLHPYAPTWIFLPTSVLVVVSRLPERLELTGSTVFPGNIRYSEVQELYLFLFISLYLYFVLKLETRNRATRQDASHAM